MKRAVAAGRQIEILKGRGMMFDDDDKAKGILLDVGYYRLGLCSFPFEKTFPRLKSRTHEYVSDTRFRYVVELYYFDSDLRQILMKYLNRIEVKFRTHLTCLVSNHYPDLPTWFVSGGVVSESYIKTLEKKVCESASIKGSPMIKANHQKYAKDKFAPAWKNNEVYDSWKYLSVI